ncbi:toll/interleukin-1 receptor domain-containing adapter protein isoform X1 [Mirounga angustirostris]|uniref:toll/interleukin-1 receptor domain-containing adapter protein isoform X1 n=1 Tax=Mirounga angustirostris TaxID=9716 RepID=UPI00313C67BA
MASSSSFPAPRARSKKPLGKMADWFRQALSKPRKLPDSAESTSRDVSQPSSRDAPPAPGLSSALPRTPPPTHVGAASSSGGRWSKDYDVCVCHSEEDLEAAQELVSYLEGSTAGLRCFLQLRDATPGGAIVSELCQALSSSHCRVLLITPGFLQDPWCRSADHQLTLLTSPWDPESWSEAENPVREPRASQGLRGPWIPAAVTRCKEPEFVALCM